MRNFICPTITAFDEHEYTRQMRQAAKFAKRVHIDLMDGDFAPTKSPGLKDIWWPHEVAADIHLMYQRPMDELHNILLLKPHMVIVHNEVTVHHMHLAGELHKAGIKIGLAILQDTPIEYAYQIMHSFDHVLVFSGDLGHHGGKADLDLLDKVKKIRAHHPVAEIGWDGGINADNIVQLKKAGVSVFNVGGFVQKSDNPAVAYAKLKRLITHNS